MKKSVLAIVVLAAFTLASCATYTCPTYSKGVPKAQPVKQTKI